MILQENLNNNNNGIILMNPKTILGVADDTDQVIVYRVENYVNKVIEYSIWGKVIFKEFEFEQK